jgi:hypothetical protein
MIEGFVTKLVLRTWITSHASDPAARLRAGSRTEFHFELSFIIRELPPDNIAKS